MYINANELKPKYCNLFNTWKSQVKILNFIMFGVNINFWVFIKCPLVCSNVLFSKRL